MSIVAERLVKAYRRRVVVNQVNISLQRGEIVGLLGQNGSGKTTIFSMISGLERATSGKVFLDQRDISRLPVFRRARLGIGYLPQEPSVFRKLSVEDNLRAVLQLRPFSAVEKRERLEELIAEFNLDLVRGQRANRISGGERRRTEVARSLAAEPSFLLLDEPFSGIDPIAVAEMQQIVSSLRNKNLGILITDHNVRETLRITDRAYIIRDGEILISGTSTEIASDSLARKFYLGNEFSL